MIPYQVPIDIGVSKAELMGTPKFGINKECFSENFEFITKLRFAELLGTLFHVPQRMYNRVCQGR